VTVNGKAVDLKEGDAILIEPKEEIYWEGELVLLISYAPAWNPEQYKDIE